MRKLPSRYTQLIAQAICFFGLFAAWHAVAAEAPASAPTDGAAAALAKILDANELKLSSGRDQKSFSFSLWLAPSQGSGTEGGELAFRVDDAGASMLVRSKDGLPYCAVQDGVYLQLDPDDPGGLIVIERGMFGAHIGGTDTGLSLNFQYAAKVAMSGITLDLKPILRRVLKRAGESRIDEKSGALVFSLPEMVAAIQVNEDADRGFPVRDVVFLSPRGKVNLSISHIHVNVPKRSTPLPAADQLRQAGFRIRELPIDVLAQQFPIPPAKFWADDRNVAAAKRLRDLLHPVAATQPGRNQKTNQKTGQVQFFPDQVESPN